MAHICFVGAPRSGSTLVCDMMYNFEGVGSYYEIFHPKKLSMQSQDVERAFRQVAGRVREKPYPEMIEVVRRRPLAAISKMRELAPENEHISFKIFQSHVPQRVIEREFLPNDDFYFVLLRRSLFDSYISRQKARTLSVFSKADTSQIKIDFVLREYIDYCRLTLRWYKWWEDKLPEYGRPVVTLTYGEQGFDPRTLTEAIQAAIAKTGLELTIKQNVRGNREKQDKTTDYRDKINNYDDLVVELHRVGLLPAEIAGAQAG